jgi:hypothetical protein
MMVFSCFLVLLLFPREVYAQNKPRDKCFVHRNSLFFAQQFSARFRLDLATSFKATFGI